MIWLAISGCELAPPTPPSGLLASREAQGAGAVIYAQHCAICHGASGNGHGARHEAMNPPPANLARPPWSEASSAGRMFVAIRSGVPRTAKPASRTLSDQEVWKVIALTYTLGSGAGPILVLSNWTCC
jgi:high-affinity iron transporter